jgi:hypothetical protein
MAFVPADEASPLLLLLAMMMATATAGAHLGEARIEVFEV